jgi:hypothetical protein
MKAAHYGVGILPARPPNGRRSGSGVGRARLGRTRKGSLSPCSPIGPTPQGFRTCLGVLRLFRGLVRVSRSRSIAAEQYGCGDLVRRSRSSSSRAAVILFAGPTVMGRPDAAAQAVDERLGQRRGEAASILTQDMALSSAGWHAKAVAISTEYPEAGRAIRRDGERQLTLVSTKAGPGA